MAEGERRLRGDAGKRSPKTSALDPGDTTLRGVASTAGGSAKPRGGGGGSRAPRAPGWLLPEALAEWRRVVPALHTAGYLEQTDVALLAMYCTAWANWRALDEQLRETRAHVAHCSECGAVVLTSGFLVEGARGNLVKTPLWQMWRDAATQLERLGKALGLAPEARARMPAPSRPPGADEKDPLNQFGGAAPDPDEGEGEGEGDDEA